MNDIDVNRVLAQIRSLKTQAGGPAARPEAAPGAAAGGAKAVNGFDTLLRGAIDRVNGAQVEAQTLQQAFETGDRNTDLSSVMLATAKAQVSFKAMVEVRNRLVSAYQEIMNMPI